MEEQTKLHFPWAEGPVHGKCIQVAEGVLWFRLPLPMRLDHVNIYVLDDMMVGQLLIPGSIPKKLERFG